MKNEEGRVKSEMSNPFVTPQQRAYILAHLNDRPRTAVARAAGVSTATLYRIVRQAGGATDSASAPPLAHKSYPSYTPYNPYRQKKKRK